MAQQAKHLLAQSTRTRVQTPAPKAGMLAYLQSQHSGQRDRGLPSNLAIQTRQISELWIQVGNHPSTGMMQSIQEETQHQYLAGTCTHINMHLYTHVPTHMKIHLHTLRYTHTRVHTHIYIKKELRSQLRFELCIEWQRWQFQHHQKFFLVGIRACSSTSPLH